MQYTLALHVQLAYHYTFCGSCHQKPTKVVYTVDFKTTSTIAKHGRLVVRHKPQHADHLLLIFALCL